MTKLFTAVCLFLSLNSIQASAESIAECKDRAAKTFEDRKKDAGLKAQEQGQRFPVRKLLKYWNSFLI